MEITEKDVINYLNKIKTKDELYHYHDILKARAKQIEQKIASKFNVGDKVKFIGKYGNEVKGTITKVNQKTIKLISTDNIRWKVSPSLLSYGED